MEKLNEMLKNPFDGLPKGNEKVFQQVCEAIAKELFCGYCIKCDDREFYFAEIEFYYYEECVWDKKWNEVTYARDGYDAGALFYHLSGIDICFNSHYKTWPVKFGGILIRAIRDEHGKVIAGPLTCKDEILNACKCGEMPRLRRASKTQTIDPKSTYRALGEKDTDKENDRLCFYDSRINDWNPVKDKYNTRKGVIEPRKGAYKTDRFDENH